MADDKGRCVNYGFLCKLRKQIDAETIVCPATSYNRDNGVFNRYSGWPDQRDITTQPTCFRNVANLQMFSWFNKAVILRLPYRPYLVASDG